MDIRFMNTIDFLGGLGIACAGMALCVLAVALFIACIACLAGLIQDFRDRRLYALEARASAAPNGRISAPLAVKQGERK